MDYQEGYYWLTSDRATTRGVAQYLNGNWYLINEAGPFSMYAINQRGWRVAEYIGTNGVEDVKRG